MATKRNSSSCGKTEIACLPELQILAVAQRDVGFTNENLSFSFPFRTGNSGLFIKDNPTELQLLNQMFLILILHLDRGVCATETHAREDVFRD